jgi:N-methylhydantoinase A
MAYRVGVDIGGTFTDFCVFNDQTNELHTLKVLSTPASPGAEVMEGMQVIAERFGVAPAEVTYFTHGTTVGINTVIQRQGARLCLFTTRNFGDVLELERLKMPDPFNLYATRSEPLIPKDYVFPIDERVLADGRVRTPLDRDSVVQAVGKAKALGAEGIIVSCINAYRNPEHELRAKEIILTEAPERFVFCSCEVWPVVREYERTITAVINGYVHPRVSHYLSSLQKALKERGIAAAPLITKSNGGVMSAERGKTSCVHILLSGPTSGVIGASYVANLCGIQHAISLDIGGTSADVALVIDGKPQYGTGKYIGDFPLFIPSVSVSSIGEGGGSIVWVDRYGVLKVGPESAGSNPGPACYGKGGNRATLTDAFAVCGFLGRTQLAYNSVNMHLDRAKEVVGHVAGQLRRGLLETAEAIIKVAVSGMFMELSKLIAKYGVDPRDFVLLAFGGAGPMLACFLARELGARRVLIPTAPGVLSALGGLIADVKNDFIRTIYRDLDDSIVPAMQQGFSELRHEAVAWLQQERHVVGAPTLVFSGDMRYQGQSFEIEVPFEEEWITEGNIHRIAQAFHSQHEHLYDYCDQAAPMQLINLRLVVVGASPKPTFKKLPGAAGEPKPITMHEVYYDGTTHVVPWYRRADLGSGCQFRGPVIIAQDDCTTCVLDGFNGVVDPYGNILLEYHSLP